METETETDPGSEYVYDIFCLQKPENIDAEGALELMPPMGSNTNNTDNTDTTNNTNTSTDHISPNLLTGHGLHGTDLRSQLTDPSAHILQIPGLHVDEGGNVLTYIDDNEQQHFVYDR